MKYCVLCSRIYYGVKVVEANSEEEARKYVKEHLDELDWELSKESIDACYDYESLNL